MLVSSDLLLALIRTLEFVWVFSLAYHSNRLSEVVFPIMLPCTELGPTEVLFCRSGWQGLALMRSNQKLPGMTWP